jgi:hypothetical protein
MIFVRGQEKSVINFLVAIHTSQSQNPEKTAPFSMM